MRIVRFFVFFMAFVLSHGLFAASQTKYPWFVGAGAGYGSTLWRGLVPEIGNQNMALSMSTPIDVDEGGLLWGFGGGVEVFSQFQLEFFYWKYPNIFRLLLLLPHLNIFLFYLLVTFAL